MAGNKWLRKKEAIPNTRSEMEWNKQNCIKITSVNSLKLKLKLNHKEDISILSTARSRITLNQDDKSIWVFRKILA